MEKKLLIWAGIFSLLASGCEKETPKPVILPPVEPVADPVPLAPTLVRSSTQGDLTLGVTADGQLLAWSDTQKKEIWSQSAGILFQNPWFTGAPEDLSAVLVFSTGLVQKRRVSDGQVLWETVLGPYFPRAEGASDDRFVTLGTPEGRFWTLDAATGRVLAQREPARDFKLGAWAALGHGLDPVPLVFPEEKKAPAPQTFPPQIQSLVDQGTLKASQILLLPDSGGPWVLDLDTEGKYLVWQSPKKSTRVLRIAGLDGQGVRLSHWGLEEKRPLTSTGGYGDLESGLRLSVKAGELTVIYAQMTGETSPFRAEVWWR